jgi:TatD DNase family protein
MDFINIHTHNLKPNEGFQLINQFVQDFPITLSGTNAASVGLHPWHVDKEFHVNIAKLKRAVLDTAVIAIGEAGLDKIKGPDLALQSEAFEAQIQLAENSEKPLIIHCVKAYNELLQLHKNHSPTVGWIVHGFAGSSQMAEQLVRRGIYLSFGGSLMKGHKKTIDALRTTPSDLMFLETDDNQDLKIDEVYKKVAEIKNMSIEQLKEAVYHNFTRCFKINLSKSV